LFGDNKYVNLFLLLVVALICYGYYPSFLDLAQQWMDVKEYSHGPLLLFVAVYIIWKKRATLYWIEKKPSWIGIALLFVGLVLFVGGEKSNYTNATNYSLILVLSGVVLAIAGSQYFKEIAISILLFFLTIPLPGILNALLTSKLQLVSSIIGASVIEMLGIPVYLSGNIIDLGNYQLFVEEACSGLNYLYALLSIGVIWAYFFKAPIWQKVTLVISAIPIAIIMNSFRIAMTAVLVKSQGIEVAEGFLHEFEGWIVFLAACSSLLCVGWILSKLQNPRPVLWDIFSVNIENQVEYKSNKNKLRVSTHGVVVFLLVSIAILYTNFISSSPMIPDRKTFSSFPLVLDEWKGSKNILPIGVQNNLNADDYLISDFANTEGEEVTLLVSYYATQSTNKGIHSPRICLTGGGWNIEQDIPIKITLANGHTKEVNRLLLMQQEVKLVAYYWFYEQGSMYTNDYMARFNLIRNAILNNRTDGALIRISTPIDDQDIEKAETRLRRFIGIVDLVLPDYLSTD
jgi:exosortase D (VPLPA-CTERM-specific)